MVKGSRKRAKLAKQQAMQRNGSRFTKHVVQIIYDTSSDYEDSDRTYNTSSVDDDSDDDGVLDNTLWGRILHSDAAPRAAQQLASLTSPRGPYTKAGEQRSGRTDRRSN